MDERRKKRGKERGDRIGGMGRGDVEESRIKERSEITRER